MRKICVMFLLALLATAVSASDAATENKPQLITLDVATGGALGGFLVGVLAWLNNKKTRMPPLGEEAAKTYATKGELQNVDAALRGEIGTLREEIKENDRKAEDRARGTHARIDAIYRTAEKTNRSLGILIGITSVKTGTNPKAFATDDE